MSDSVTLLPPNATELEKALARCAARVSQLGVTAKMLALWNPATCPAATLPWLAQALHVDEWSETWTEAQKRAVIASSVATHKRKGTIGALKRALSALGYEVVVDEDTGIPFTFRLAFDLNQTGPLTGETFAAAKRVALANKNARSHLLAVRSSLTAEAGLHIGVAHYRAQTVTADAGTYDLSLYVTVAGGGVYLSDAPVTLTATVTGPGEITGQWSKDGEDIEGETGLTLTFTMDAAAQGEYTYTATNGLATMWGSAVVGYYTKYFTSIEPVSGVTCPYLTDTESGIIEPLQDLASIGALPYLLEIEDCILLDEEIEPATITTTPYFLDEASA